MVDLSHVVKPFRRNRLSVGLIALQVIVACSIVANLLSIVAERQAPLSVVSGVDELHTYLVHSVVSVEAPALAAARATDVAALARLPGVEHVATFSTVPLSGSSWSTTIKTAPGDQAGAQTNVHLFAFGPQGLASLGIRPTEGRDFEQSEYGLLDPAGNGKRQMPAAVIVSGGLAKHLWPNQSAVGQRLYFSDTDVATVIGVVDQFASGAPAGDPTDQWTVLLPRTPNSAAVRYALHVPSGSLSAEQVRQTLVQANPSAFVESVDHYPDMRRAYFHTQHDMIRLLLEAAAALIAVTAIGIGGLSAYWVHQRRRATGIRRTLGAKRSDILGFFVAENLLIVVPSSVLGGALAWCLNRGLMRYFEVGPIPLAWIACGALALIGVGLAAAAIPAWQAAFMPPVEATRRRS